MSTRVSMEFGPMVYESLRGQRDPAGNSFMMVTPKLKTSLFDEQPYDSSLDHINQSKLELERMGIYTTDMPRDGKIRKGLLQLTQDPANMTDQVTYGTDVENRLISNGFGYAIEGRLNSFHEWTETHTILEPWVRFSSTREHASSRTFYRTRMQTVDIFPEMRVKILCHPSGRGSLEWLYSISRSEQIGEMIKITLVY